MIFLDKFKRPSADALGWDNVKGLLIEEYMKRASKNKKQESDNALLSSGKSSYRGRFQPRGGAGSGRGRGDRLRNFSSNAKSSHDEGVKHKSVKCFKHKQNRHIVKNCPYNNKENTGKRESSNMAELEGVALISSTINQSN